MNRYKGLVKSELMKYNTSLPFDIVADSKTKAKQIVCEQYDVEPEDIRSIYEYKPDYTKQ